MTAMRSENIQISAKQFDHNPALLCPHMAAEAANQAECHVRFCMLFCTDHSSAAGHITCKTEVLAGFGRLDCSNAFSDNEHH